MGRDYSAYQRSVIRRYYERRGEIDGQRLAELVTEIYLATTEKRLSTLWKRASTILARMGGEPEEQSFVQTIVTNRDVEALAELVGRSS